MRKGLALLLAFSFLLIGSIPMLASTQLLAAKHMHHDSSTSTAENHLMSDNMKQCRIECACGCHDNMDTLPLLLSPHVISSSSQTRIHLLATQYSHAEPISHELHLPIPIPPPKYYYS
ncbi:MAG: hypothetical protein Q9M20_01990 [Mariprofundaceae bacterium]|nr:hypothetical protein [Mariprofundaceae bacterium]